MVVLPKRNRLAERREATRLDILNAAWEVARQDSPAGLTLREVANRVGMQPPSLYSHFASKNAIYDAMFEQAWRTLLDQISGWVENMPSEPRARLIKGAELYFDFAVADLARHQLMDTKIIPNFEPSPQAYAASVEAYSTMGTYLPLSDQDDIDVYTALISGLIAQQLANDPGGQRWRRLIPRVMSMFADDLGLPSIEPPASESS
jgi:AcrR family transcriptional regulator